jgi:hypothetical protein
MAKEMTIGQRERDELLIYADLITARNRAYNSAQAFAIYDLYNRIYGETKKPNGCGACLRTTLQHLRRALETLSQ